MQKQTDNIYPYVAGTDATTVFSLWEATLGQTWPISFPRFQQILATPDAQHFVARENGQLVGFVATSRSQRQGNWTGHFMLLLVDPAWQNQGFGSALHEIALQHLRSAHVLVIQLGGLVPRFWCGAPDNLTSTHAFFRARGWELSETVYDLSQDLRQYTTLPAIYQRIATQGITLNVATQADLADVLSFEAREFPNWLMHYERCGRLGDYQDILLAREQDGQVVGALILYTAQSHAERTDLIWQALVGEDAGALGAVGVAAAEQGRGIGIALVARASDLLKERGVGVCVIDWVEKTDFYARLGYTKWRAYHPEWRDLS